MQRQSEQAMSYFRARQPEYGCPILSSVMWDTYRFMTGRRMNGNQNQYLRDAYTRMYDNYNYYRCEMYR
jgi:hypothetical protein